LIYLDESARSDQFYFFGALIVDATAARRIDQGLNDVAALIARHVPEFSPSAEFHAVDIFHGESDWDVVPVGWRVKACDLAAKVIARSGAKFVFRGVDVQAQRARYGRNAFPAHLLTLAHTLEEVDRQLGIHDRPDQLGLALADDHHTAPGARRSLRSFRIERVPGYTQRPVTRLADTIYFGPSDESRLLQAADVATYFLNRSRTIVENDPRSARAIAKIVANIRSITVDEYVWRP
jgi:hypothetical protein